MDILIQGITIDRSFIARYYLRHPTFSYFEITQIEITPLAEYRLEFSARDSHDVLLEKFAGPNDLPVSVRFNNWANRVVKIEIPLQLDKVGRVGGRTITGLILKGHYYKNPRGSDEYTGYQVHILRRRSLKSTMQPKVFFHKIFAAIVITVKLFIALIFAFFEMLDVDRNINPRPPATPSENEW
jgi:hypothetical protein